MPFKSEAQRRFLHAKHPVIAKRWEAHTPKGKDLPEHVAKKKSPREKAAGFDDVGAGMLSLGGRLGGKQWAKRLSRLKARADAGDESAQQILSALGIGSMLMGAGTGAVVGKFLGYPSIGGAAGAALGVAPALAAGEKKTPVLMPGFTGEAQPEAPDLDQLGKQANGAEEGGAETPQEEAAEELDPDKATSLINFIAEHGDKGIDDDDFHAHAESIGVDPHEAEEEVYRTLASLLGGKNDLVQGGKAQGLPNSMFPKDELQAAVKVEKEHTPSTAIATEIGKDHEIESTKYYTGKDRLGDMEKDIEKKKEQGKEEGAAPDQQKQAAFKYGFMLKIAELGMTPSEFTKAALTGPLMAAGAVGKAGESASGIGQWGLEKTLDALKFGVKTPLIVAPVLGMLLGGAYRGLTAPSYETPGDLQSVETIALYKRLAREALRAARKKQLKRLQLTGESEKEIRVPALAG
jgi:hypothetical protein